MSNKPQRQGIWRRGFPLAGLFSLAAGLLVSIVDGSAQTSVRGRPCEGQTAFVVVDRQTGQTVSRGWTTPDGTLGPGLVLGPNRDYVFIFVKPNEGLIGEMPFITGPNGSTTEVPRTQMGTSIDRDSDGDGVQDEIENVFGTNPRNPSTFGGGISDRAFVTTPPPPGTQVGSGFPSIAGNPSFGPPGIVQSIALAGICVDVSAFNELVALACLDRGVAVFNVFGGGAPRLIATIDTPGEARAVGSPENDIPVADGAGGLVIIDVRDPAAAAIRTRVLLGSYAQAVASAADIAYVGLRNGQLVVVELGTGTEMQRLNLGSVVHDVFIAGDFVWVAAVNDLFAFSPANGLLTQAGRVSLSSVSADPFSGRKRLFVGGGIAYAATSRGFDAVDVRNPAAMVILGRVPSTGPGSFKQIVANGSGLGVAPAGVNPRQDGTHHVSLFDLSDPADTGGLITILNTPGTAYANTIYNGLSYVADGERGLQVLRYMETDRLGIAPTVILGSNAAAGGAEEGQVFRATADARDDIQVRNVEFYVDGERRVTDGNFPFEFSFPAPLRSPGRSSFTVRARAFDTGGNSAWSDPLTIELRPDMTPPHLVGRQPLAGSIVGQPDAVIALFSEPLRGDSLTAEAFRLVHTGADGLLGTADDQAAPPGTLLYEEGVNAAGWRFFSPLPAGRWHATVRAPIADRAGNPLGGPTSWNFYVFDQPDRDADGLPDALETAFNLDPENPDTRGDGVRDGQRDFDSDGLANAWEIFWGFDASNPRSRDPNIRDGDLDLDADALSNSLEQLAGSHPLLADSDQDGWNDEAEATFGSDPLDPASKPRYIFAAVPKTAVFLPNFTASAGFRPAPTLAYPVVSVSVPSASNDENAPATIVAMPKVALGLPAVAAAEGSPRSTIVSQPPVFIGVTASGHEAGRPVTTIAQPPVKVRFSDP